MPVGLLFCKNFFDLVVTISRPRITNFSNNEKMTFTKARMLCVKYNFYDSERLPGSDT